MTAYKGNYYDGKSSQPYKVKVQLTTSYLQINFLSDEDFHENALKWDLQKINGNEFNNNKHIILTYGEFPFQTLEIESPDFYEELQAKYRNIRFTRSHYAPLLNSGFKGLLVSLLASILLISLGYFYAIPLFAETVAAYFPRTYEKILGRAIFNKLTQEQVILTRESKLLSEFVQASNLQTNLPLEKVVVVQSSIVNAFALPGGYIIIHKPLLEMLNEPEELVALLAHEYSHVELRHSIRHIFRALSRYVFISIIIGDMSGVTAVIVENANLVKTLHFSRTLEKEADLHGLEIMQKTQINPQGMVNLLRILENYQAQELQDKNSQGKTQEKNELKNVTNMLEMVSSHPLIEKRIQYVQEIINKDREAYSFNKRSDKVTSIWRELKKQSK
ncbi:MAG TPA: M48 family metallopeptidase [Vampirovibrionales bacterium]